jgi:anthranilate synthase/aminodeoxychorismate synthase-like glutamine amidotransferase
MPERPRVVFLDNVDSFTYNLVDEFARRGAAVAVFRNDRPAAEIAAAAGGARLLVISPGPGTPAAAGATPEVIRRCAGRVPVFGVCLGLQAVVEVLGGRVERAPEVLHGKAARVRHRGGPLFDGLPSPMPVGRYHSLCATVVPDGLEVTAECDGMVMAVEHRTQRLAGVQFHPESILTPGGGRLLDNVLRWAAR